ncbi:FkbM family methyltransferase [Parafrankia soli]|nr:FkbM family methyltransferase [Parafrankia soli]
MSLAGFHYDVVSDYEIGTHWKQPWKSARVAWRELDRSRPDCVIVHGYAHSFAIAALAWCRARRVPALLFGDSEMLAPRRRRVAAGKRMLLPLLFNGVSGFLTIGDNNETYLSHYGVPRSKMFRMPIPTDEGGLRLALLKREDHRLAVRSELGLPPDAVVALFVGKLITRKRPMDIAAALRVLARGPDGPRLTVLLAGDGELRGQLDRVASELDGTLRPLGFTEPHRLAVLYAAADFYVHPAERDAHPLAIKDAVLSGLPVVTTDRVGSVGPTDDVRPGRNGRVYPVGDVPALAAVLDDLRRHPDRLAELARESERVACEIDVHAAVAGFQRAVTAVASPRSPVARSSRSMIFRIKIAMAGVLTSPVAARIVETATRDQIRNNGIRFDVSGSDFTARTKAQLFWHIYESAEIRLIHRNLRGASTVVELGSSLGITTAHIASVVAPGGRIVCVEANPRLIEGLQSRLSPHLAHMQLDVEHAAISTEQGTATFSVCSNVLGSRLAARKDGETVSVPASTLRQILAKHGVDEFDLVSDVEGAEASFLLGDPEVLRRCRRAVLELHDTTFQGRHYSTSDLLAAAQTAGFRVAEQHGAVVALVRT